MNKVHLFKYSNKYLWKYVFVRLRFPASINVSYIRRLKEETFLHQHIQAQVSKGSTLLMSGYQEQFLCLQKLNPIKYGATSLPREKQTNKKQHNTDNLFSGPLEGRSTGDKEDRGSDKGGKSHHFPCLRRPLSISSHEELF